MPITAPTLAPSSTAPSGPNCTATSAVPLCVVASPAPFLLSEQLADALYAAAEAKEALLAAQDNLSRATAVLDKLVEDGELPERNLPLVSGFVIYRQEGRLSWTYPPAIKELEAALKKRKQLAEQLGDASHKRGNPFWTIKPASEGVL